MKGTTSKFLSSLLTIIMLLCIALTTTGCGGSSDDEGDFIEAQNPVDENLKWELLRKAYTYTYPLVLMHSTIEKGTNISYSDNYQAPINQFAHVCYRADASYEGIHPNHPEEAYPNVETILSQVYLNLASEPVVIERPITSRFSNFELLDAYTNCATTFGSGGETDYRLYIITGPTYKGNIPEGMYHIQLPTQLGWLVGRTVCFSDEDLENVLNLQTQMRASTLSRYNTGGPAPEGVYDGSKDYIPSVHVYQMNAATYFNLANDLMLTNPPASIDEPLMEQLAKIGIGPGLKFNESILGENGQRFYESMKSELKSIWSSEASQYVKINNRWQFYTVMEGKYGTLYNYRAFLASNNLGILPNSICITPKRFTDDEGQTLTGKNEYKLHFPYYSYCNGPLYPPTKNSGFWVVSVYDNNGRLIENDIKRYFISSNDNLKVNEDGSVDIFLQKSEYVASEATNASGNFRAALEEGTASGTASPTASPNWLPIGEGNFSVYLKIYIPKPDAINGGYVMPKIYKNDDKNKKKK